MTNVKFRVDVAPRKKLLVVCGGAAADPREVVKSESAALNAPRPRFACMFRTLSSAFLSRTTVSVYIYSLAYLISTVAAAERDTQTQHTTVSAGAEAVVRAPLTETNLWLRSLILKKQARQAA